MVVNLCSTTSSRPSPFAQIMLQIKNFIAAENILKILAAAFRLF